MNTTLRNLLVASVLLSAAPASGQSHFTEKTVRWLIDPGIPGHNFWIAPAQNIPDKSGNRITFYITSPNNTLAHVHCEGTDKAVPVPSYGVGTFTVPLAIEMQSSGVVENKGIHVYDNTDDITVCLKSTSTYSGEGMYCIPSRELGTDYVVAGYESFFDFTDSSYDFPSEFTITAEQDSTIVEIIPSCGLRKSDSFPTFNNITAFQKGKPFEVRLNRGQCIQYQAVLTRSSANNDVTGTTIHSSNPVGVVGASMLCNIPYGFPYPNYICDMMPPIPSWGKTYYTTNNLQLPYEPDTIPGHDYSLYCLISSVPSQTIYRHDCSTGDHVEAVLGPSFDHYYAEEFGANKWYSDQPFMLVQYFNSSTYPDGKQVSGDPSEVVIYPRESFSKSTIFVTPTYAGAQQASENHINIVVNIKDTNNVTMDGQKIQPDRILCLDDTFEMYVLYKGIGGAHHVSSDSGCAVYVYDGGAESNDRVAFSWSAPNYSTTFNPKDTITPNISFTNGNTCVHAAISDTGTGLWAIRLDTTFNLTFAVDASFVPNSGVSKSFADICVADTNLSGYLYFTVFDLAGQGRSGIITYTPSTPAGVADGLQTKVCATLTPNPATKSVSLNFTLPQTADVTFELSSIDGKKVLEWKTDAQSDGEHSQKFDISSLPSGSYIYRLEANSQVSSGKLIINR